MLQADYEGMIDAQVLDDPLSFDALVERIRALQDEVNAAAQTWTVSGD